MGVVAEEAEVVEEGDAAVVVVSMISPGAVQVEEVAAGMHKKMRPEGKFHWEACSGSKAFSYSYLLALLRKHEWVVDWSLCLLSLCDCVMEGKGCVIVSEVDKLVALFPHCLDQPSVCNVQYLTAQLFV